MAKIAEPKAFKSSDGNGGHIVTYDDKRRRKETIIGGIIIASCSGILVALISGIFVWGFNDRKDALAAIAGVKSEVVATRGELTTYIGIAETINDMQTTVINKNTKFLAEKYKWNPCPDPIPKISELKKEAQ